MTTLREKSERANVFARLDRVEQDLDCDCDGSLAQVIADLHVELRALRAMIEELRA